jgi:hypothetical protein
MERSTGEEYEMGPPIDSGIPVPPAELEDRSELEGWGHHSSSDDLFKNVAELDEVTLQHWRQARQAYGQTIPGLHKYLATLPPDVREHVYRSLLAYVDKHHETVAEITEAFLGHIINKGYLTLEAVQTDYPSAWNAMSHGRAVRDRRRAGYNNIVTHWGEVVAKQLTDCGIMRSMAIARAAGECATAVQSWEEARKRISRAYVARREGSHGVAKRNEPQLSADDFRNAKTNKVTDMHMPQSYIMDAAFALGLTENPVISVFGVPTRGKQRSKIAGQPSPNAQLPPLDKYQIVPGVPNSAGPTRRPGQTAAGSPIPGPQWQRASPGATPVVQSPYGAAYGTGGALSATPGAFGSFPATPTPIGGPQPGHHRRVSSIQFGGGGATVTPPRPGPPSPGYGGYGGGGSPRLGSASPRQGSASPRTGGAPPRGATPRSPRDIGELGTKLREMGLQLRSVTEANQDVQGTTAPPGTLGFSFLHSPPDAQGTPTLSSQRSWLQSVDQASGESLAATFVEEEEEVEVSGYLPDGTPAVIKQRQRKQRKLTVVEKNTKIDGEVGTRAYYEAQTKRKCKCDKYVDQEWLEEVQNASGVFAAQKAMEYLSRYIDIIGATDSKGTGRMVCYRHAFAIGGHLGMLIKKLDHEHLVDRLRTVYRETRMRPIEAMQVTAKYSYWFRISDRPAVPSDALGPYRYFPMRPDVIYKIDSQQQLKLFQIAMENPNATMTEWQNNGTINLSMFEWVLESDILAPILKAEYEMYLWHQRKINGRDNYGWLRTMFYGLIQQLVRMYPPYWALYAALRPDQQVWLVSYPYYAKYSTAGDRTEFRHIDLNARLMFEARLGLAQIQGSVSWTDERSNDCTILVPGMHKWFDRWVPRLISRKQDKDGEVTAINKKNLSDAELAEFGSRWESVPCGAGQVRVSMPHLAHGAIGPAVSTRQTMLPWYCLIRKDHVRLEIEAGGTWQDLATAHRDMVPGPSSPSGKPNAYGNIPYRFPASVQLHIPGEPLSDALVGRRRWDSEEVQGYLHQFLNQPLDKTLQHMANWRKKAETAVAQAWETVKRQERVFFPNQNKSYVRSRIDHTRDKGPPPQWPTVDFDQINDQRGGYEFYGDATEAEQPVDLEPRLAPEDNPGDKDVKQNPIRNRKRN